LEEAHSKGLIHRDIKPDNIALCESGGVCDFAKVLDFGLVHFLNGKVDDGEQKFLAGTPEYMSPEAIHRPTEIDHRTDVYALGAVGYYLLTGQPVFPITVVPELLKAHLETQPETPSQRVGRRIDDDLEAVILNCLEKSADMRPSSAIQLAALLSACQAANKWSFEEARNWWDIHRHCPVAYDKLASEPSAPQVEQRPTKPYGFPSVPARPSEATTVESSAIQLRPDEAFLLSPDLGEIQFGETFIMPLQVGSDADGD
jgi:serine/threonine protein kinase